MKNANEMMQRSPNSDGEGAEQKEETEKRINEIIEKFPHNTADNQTYTLRDFSIEKKYVDKKFEDLDSKELDDYSMAKKDREIISLLEQKLLNSTLVDLGTNRDMPHNTALFAKEFGVKNIIGIDIVDIKDDFEKIFSKMDVPAQFVHDDYLSVLSKLEEGNYNFSFFNPPYSIDTQLSHPESVGHKYWKEFFRYLGKLIPKGNILITDIGYGDVLLKELKDIGLELTLKRFNGSVKIFTKV